MFYVGLDIHAKSISICVLDDHGQVYRQWQVRQIDQMMDRLKTLPGRFRVCYEASTGYGMHFEAFSEVADHVAVAHPGLLRLIFRSKRKNDRIDAYRLAKLLYLDEVPTVYVPSADVRAWRELITFRRRLVEKRTRVKNGIRALLRPWASRHRPSRPCGPDAAWPGSKPCISTTPCMPSNATCCWKNCSTSRNKSLGWKRN